MRTITFQTAWGLNKAGETAGFDDAVAAELIAAGIAKDPTEATNDEPAQPAPEPDSEPQS